MENWVACPLCGMDNAKVLFKSGDYQHVRCQGCQFVFVNPQPESVLEANAKLYDGTTPTVDNVERGVGVAQVRPRRAKKYAAEIRRLEEFKNCGELLDVGSAGGQFLLAAREKGWRVRGVEVAPENAKCCREDHGLDVHLGTLQSARFESGRFDAVRLSQVIEHLTDPLEMLEEIARVLRPGGVLSLATVNIDSYTFSYLGSKWGALGGSHNEHIAFFDRRTLEAAFAKVGLVGRVWRTNGCRLTPFRAKRSPVMGKLRRMLEKVVGNFSVLTGKGDGIAVFAVKEGSGP